MTSLYILKLENDKYYIGISANLQKRLDLHFTNRGSTWTKKHKPIEVVETIENGSKKLEREKTLEYMRIYGYQNVRGGAWCSSGLIMKPAGL